MKYINKYNNFNLINESFEEEKREELLPDLIDILADMIDDDFRIILGGVNGKEFTLNNYIDLNKEERSDYINGFNPIYKAGNKIKSELLITVRLGEFDYDKLTEIINGMLPVKNRLGDMGWTLTDMKFNFEAKSYKYVVYNFTKPDIKTDDALPSEKEIKDKFEHFGMTVDNVEYDDNFCYVGAESNSYDGEFPKDIEDKLDRILKMFGFDYYEHELNRTRDWLAVKFWINTDGEEIE